jgi:hypothetical protein
VQKEAPLSFLRSWYHLHPPPDTVRGLFKWAVDDEHHDKNPTDGIKVKKDNGEGIGGVLFSQSLVEL